MLVEYIFIDKITKICYHFGMDRYQRTELLLGEEKLNNLKQKTVAVFGVGGVGGYACEALARAGVGHIILVDGDVVASSNINRQIIALSSTVGKPKVDVMKERILDINPTIEVDAIAEFFDEDKKGLFDLSKIDYIVDAIDRITNKISLIVWAKENNTKIISAMGAGNKLDPTAFEVSDIYKTTVCPLAKVMRKELKQRGIKDLNVVYSKEPSIKIESEYDGKAVCGSVSFVPSVMGLIMAGEVIKDL